MFADEEAFSLHMDGLRSHTKGAQSHVLHNVQAGALEHYDRVHRSLRVQIESIQAAKRKDGATTLRDLTRASGQGGELTSSYTIERLEERANVRADAANGGDASMNVCDVQRALISFVSAVLARAQEKVNADAAKAVAVDSMYTAACVDPSTVVGNKEWSAAACKVVIDSSWRLPMMTMMMMLRKSKVLARRSGFVRL